MNRFRGFKLLLLPAVTIYAIITACGYTFVHISTLRYDRCGTRNNNLDVIQNKPVTEIRMDFALREVPKVIYMFWDKGFHMAPPMQKACLESFQHHNTDYEILTLNLNDAEKLIEREKHYSDQAWQSASIQAKSDIIRVELLANYGGVWADATVYCMEPLSNWLNESLLSQGFLSYERKDGVVHKHNSPWITSWFLVANNNSAMIKLWRSEVRRAWRTTPSPVETFGYFWVHSIFRNLVWNDTTFRNMFRAMPFLDAGRPWCRKLHGSTPHVYKIKASYCRKIREHLLTKYLPNSDAKG